MAMVRIVGIEEEAVPAAVEYILQCQRDDHSSCTAARSRSCLSLTEKVADDIRLIKAMETARARAQSLAALVKERGWDEGLAAFNAENASDEKVSKPPLRRFASRQECQRLKPKG
jgi:hypothetical protein